MDVLRFLDLYTYTYICIYTMGIEKLSVQPGSE